MSPTAQGIRQDAAPHRDRSSVRRHLVVRSVAMPPYRRSRVVLAIWACMAATKPPGSGISQAENPLLINGLEYQHQPIIDSSNRLSEYQQEDEDTNAPVNAISDTRWQLMVDACCGNSIEPHQATGNRYSDGKPRKVASQKSLSCPTVPRPRRGRPKMTTPSVGVLTMA